MAQLYIKYIMCLIIAAVADAGVLKSRQISLPPGAIVMDVAIRQNNNNTVKTIATMKIEIDGDDKKVTVFDAAAEMPPDKVVEIEKKPGIMVPSIEDRSIFPRGNCAKGYVRRGNVCFPDDDK